jgi:signal transduction histidine kinase
MQRWLEHLYRERPDRYLQTSMVIAMLGIAALLTPIATAVISRYEGMSTQQWATSFAVAEPFVLGAMVLGGYVCRREFSLVKAWITQPRQGQSAIVVSAAAHALPRRLLVIAGTCAAVVAGPIGILTTLHQIDRLRFADFVLLYVGGAGFSVWGVVAVWVWLELSFRPVLADMPPDVAELRPTMRGSARFGVTARLSLALVSALLAGACYAGSLSAPSGQAFSGLWRLVSIMAAVSALFALLFVPLFSALLVAPIRLLTSATRSVGAGDLDTHLPVTSRDELGELAASFNTMVGGLKERTDLRARNNDLIAELQASRERIVAAGDLARRRVERDLHDGAQQRLVTARLKAGLLRRHLENGDDVSALMTDLETEISRALEDLRELAHGIYPAQLDEEGLPGALTYAVAQAPVAARLTCDGVTRYRPELEAAVYFSCLEALQNVAKHAGAGSTAHVALHESDGVLHFSIRDDGAGFEPAGQRTSMGLQNVSDRIGALGGSVRVDSASGAGTCLSGEIPVEAVALP